jgi:hypothetical protein
MRALTALFVALCAMGFPIEAHALGLTFCDDIKDDQSRMACLQAHISHLEQTILALGGRIAALENELTEKLSADVTYKLRSAGQGKCLGLAGQATAPVLVTCDDPASWVLLAGVPIRKPKPPAPASNPATNPTDAPPPPTETSAPPTQLKPPNPCKGLDQPSCAAKSESCAWKPDKNRCARRASR